MSACNKRLVHLLKLKTMTSYLDLSVSTFDALLITVYPLSKYILIKLVGQLELKHPKIETNIITATSITTTTKPNTYLCIKLQHVCKFPEYG